MTATAIPCQPDGMTETRPTSTGTATGTATGTENGFDLEMLRVVRREVGVPLIASGGAGTPDSSARYSPSSRRRSSASRSG